MLAAPDGYVHLYGYFKGELYELLGDTEVANTYINDIMVVGKDGFPKYIDHLRVVLSGLRNAGLKSLPKKSVFGLMMFLSYTI